MNERITKTLKHDPEEGRWCTNCGADSWNLEPHAEGCPVKFYKDFKKSQIELDEEMARLLYENLWYLYG